MSREKILFFSGLLKDFCANKDLHITTPSLRRGGGASVSLRHHHINLYQNSSIFTTGIVKPKP